MLNSPESLLNDDKNYAMKSSFITADPEILGGIPVFTETRVPVAVLFENLIDGLSINEIIDSYPALKREQVIVETCV